MKWFLSIIVLILLASVSIASDSPVNVDGYFINTWQAPAKDVRGLSPSCLRINFRQKIDRLAGGPIKTRVELHSSGKDVVLKKALVAWEDTLGKLSFRGISLSKVELGQSWFGISPEPSGFNQVRPFPTELKVPAHQRGVQVSGKFYPLGWEFAIYGGNGPQGDNNSAVDYLFDVGYKFRDTKFEAGFWGGQQPAGYRQGWILRFVWEDDHLFFLVKSDWVREDPGKDWNISHLVILEYQGLGQIRPVFGWEYEVDFDQYKSVSCGFNWTFDNLRLQFDRLKVINGDGRSAWRAAVLAKF